MKNSCDQWAILYYVLDPMCSWCWAFHPVLERLLTNLPENIDYVRLLGGLAPDSDQPMPEELQRKIQGIWRTIEVTVPGTQFNFDFWKKCKPRRATYAACRAVIAAKKQAPEREGEMILSIQKAYYREAKNPSEKVVLIGLAEALGLNRDQFARDLDAPETATELERQIRFARAMGVLSFPSLVFENSLGFRSRLDIDYRDADFILRQIVRESEYRG